MRALFFIGNGFDINAKLDIKAPEIISRYAVI